MKDKERIGAMQMELKQLAQIKKVLCFCLVVIEGIVFNNDDDDDDDINNNNNIDGNPGTVRR